MQHCLILDQTEYVEKEGKNDISFLFFVHILFIIHSTSLVLLSIGNPFMLVKARGLFFRAPIPLDGKQSSSKQSPTLAGTWQAFLFSILGPILGNEGTLTNANAENSSLFTSKPFDSRDWLLKALQAFSRIDCKYFPCASIRSCRRRCTYFGKPQRF